SFELGGKRTSLLAHQAPLSRQGFSPKSVSGISRPLHKPKPAKATAQAETPVRKELKLGSLDQLIAPVDPLTC
ncbi:hypothetical protein ACSES2_29885, partial [Pseudomonas aeruginosa]